MRRILQRLVFLTCAGLVLCCASCNYGPERIKETGATLEGTVKYGTQPVLVALVIVQNANGSATGMIEEDGKYKLTNVPLGEVQVAVNVGAGEGQLMSKRMDPSQKGKIPAVVHVPKKYEEPNTSDLKTTIEKGPNKFDIVIPK